VLRTVNDQPTLWDAILPAEALVMSSELTRVDGLLDDPVFFAPFVPFFDPRVGRPSIPMETYLRLMFLRARRALCVRTWTTSWLLFRDHPSGRHRSHLPRAPTACPTSANTLPGEGLPANPRCCPQRKGLFTREVARSCCHSCRTTPAHVERHRQPALVTGRAATSSQDMTRAGTGSS
jgi:hypothetical protein